MLESAQSVIQLLQTATAISFAVALFSLILAYLYFRRSRTQAYWRQRRQAGDRGLQCAMLTAFSLAVSLALCAITLTVSYVENSDTPQESFATQPTDETTTPISTPTLTPEPTASLARPETDESPAASPESETDAATVTPEPTPEPQALAVNLQITALDDVISDTLTAIQPGTNFPNNTQRIYVFLDYQDMPAGILWWQTLSRDGEMIQKYSQRWGDTPAEGQTFFFFGDSEGLPSGSYEVQFLLGTEETLLAIAQFTIQ